MNKFIKQLWLPVIALVTLASATGCMRSGYKDLIDSSNKDLSAVNYTYRFLYNDTIQKGTPKQEIQLDRVCEVIFSKNSVAITDNGVKGFTTTLTHNVNSVMKAGPTGSVTRAMLYERFKTLIQTDGLSKLWVYVTISDVAKVTPLNSAPELGKPGDFTQDRSYRVTAADGSHQDYVLKTVKGF